MSTVLIIDPGMLAGVAVEELYSDFEGLRRVAGDQFLNPIEVIAGRNIVGRIVFSGAPIVLEANE